MIRYLVAASCAAALQFSSLAQAQSGLSVRYESAIEDSARVARQALQSSEAITALVNGLNRDFRLEVPIEVIFGAQDGPLYDSEQRQIWIPYRFDSDVRQRFAEDDYEQTGISVDEAVEDAMLHTLLHEFGHALVDQYQLPIVGREEDAVDTLATILLVEYFENGQEIALSAADLFALESEDEQEGTEEALQGEHSLSAQRYYHTACLVYGSAPEDYAALMEELQFSQERADGCIDEYAVAHSSWFTLLAPWLRDQN